jgi:hypothetical protein
MGLVMEKDKAEGLRRKEIARINLEKAGNKFENLADKNCKKCYGRGYTGLTQDDKKIMCKCVRKNLFKEPEVSPVRQDNENHSS